MKLSNIKVLMIILSVFSMISILFGCGSKDDYTSKYYDSEEEMKQIYFNNQKIMDDAANIFYDRKECFRYVGEKLGYKYINSPNMKGLSEFFDESEWEKILNFFYLTQPFSVSYRCDNFTSNFRIKFYYRGKIKDDFDGDICYYYFPDELSSELKKMYNDRYRAINDHWYYEVKAIQ